MQLQQQKVIKPTQPIQKPMTPEEFRRQVGTDLINAQRHKQKDQVKKNPK